jgi:hypothetical protein
MNIVTELITRITTLLEGLSFDHKPTGNKTTVQIIDSFLERPGVGWIEGEEFPMVRVAEYSGGFLSRGRESNVVVVGGIWTAGNIAAGTADIKLLAEALGDLTKVRTLGEYRLTTPIKYYFGETEKGHEGQQPHPYHFVTFFLDFSTLN